MLQAHDLLDGLDLCIGRNLGGTGIPYIQQLAPKPQPSRSQEQYTFVRMCMQTSQRSSITRTCIALLCDTGR